MSKRGLVIFIWITILFGQSNLEKGHRVYDRRSEGSHEDVAQPEPINEAIAFYIQAMDDPDAEVEATIALLKSYYFKGKYACKSEDEQKVVFNKAKSLAMAALKKYPHRAEIHYWYTTNLGSWAEIYGIFSAAKEGVADQIKVHAMKVIELDPHYENGGGYFMMGVIHYKSPYIPFLLSWPDNKEAVAFLEKAVGTGEATPVQKVYLAQALYKEKDKQRALAILNEVASMKPYMDELLYDWEQIKKARGLLKDLQ